MFQSLKEFFDAVLSSAATREAASDEHALRLATAVMLVEVMRADASFEASERAAVLTALRDRFDLSPDEAAQLTELAVTTARGATDLFAFTSRINDHFDMPQKLRMVEHMWRVAYADGHLSDHERHVLWRIADLLHVPQGAYVHAKLRVQEEIRAASGSGA
ncbi:MAG: TerB family tellurite resistance protein [Burkholderiaceae bacterium]|nr:TerB family tellurite resistance protein [Burkholderiaceae bacterium]